MSVCWDDSELDELVRIARAAAAVVMEVYATPFSVEMKGPGDPVTRADREANALICRELEASFPGEAIFAEESVPESGGELAARFGSERVFFVDPLDGTREFADRNGEFAVMIGLAERGRASLGVMVTPTTGDAFAGRAPSGAGPDAAAGAFLEASGGARRPLTVSAVSAPTEATMIVSRSHRPRIVQPVMDRLGIARVVPCGSVGVKIARLMTGAADLYVHGGGAKLWDSCAPEAILRAAGGRFTDLAGAPIDYTGALAAGLEAADAGLPANAPANAPTSADLKRRLQLQNGIIATNGALHDAVVDAVRAALG